MSEDRKDDSHYQKMSEINDKSIELTLHEILFIDDHISLMIDGRDFEHMLPLKPAVPSALLIAPIDFIEKIGKAFVQVLRTGKNVRIKISEMELYMLREICFTRVEYFGKHVGLSLKRKVLHALYATKTTQDDLLEQLLKDKDLGEN